jgi:hypothetical protein
MLHEPFADQYDKSPTSSLARCLTSAKCVVNSIYVLYQSSYDMSGTDPCVSLSLSPFSSIRRIDPSSRTDSFLPFAWSVVGRALVRDHAVRRLWGDMEAAKTSRQLAEHCLSFTSSCAKSGLGIAGEFSSVFFRTSFGIGC